MASNSRVTQQVVEVVNTGTPASRISQEIVEVIAVLNPNSRISQAMVEVLVSDYTLGIAGGARSQIVTTAG